MGWVAAVCAGLSVWLVMTDEARLRHLVRARRRGSIAWPRWLPRLPRRAEVQHREAVAAEVPETLELLAAALEAGLPPRVAAAEVARGGPPAASVGLAQVVSRVEVGLSEAEAWGCLVDDPSWGDAAREMARSVHTGTGAAVALRRLADEGRTRRRDAVTKRARAVGVRAVWPLMACYLPAFLLVGVVPIIAGLVSNLGLR